MSDAPKPGDPGRDAYLAEGNAKQARKRVAADALIRNQQGLLLLVHPTYKDGWDLPGGMSEENEEPLTTVHRELTEELGLADINMQGLLCVDWVEPHGPWDDLLAFVFDGGVLSHGQIEQMAPGDDELSEYGFFKVQEALHLLPARQRARADQALRALDDGSTRYLRNGVPEWPTAGSRD
ncbi:NUDIX hydrolase [Streptomyces sp. NPDC006251]|uniref:NUDIX hydrolase n=1 Tax=Streptomyces sp. NPDC006251 TaxID=3155718 RepID=UPI0033A65947